MIVFLTGKETYLIHHRRQQLKKKFREKYPNAILDTFDIDEDSTYEQVRESLLQGGGLFSMQKLVDIRNIFSFDPQKQEKMLAVLEGQALENQELAVIISQSEIKDKKSKLYKFLKEKTKPEEMAPLEGLKLKTWIAGEVISRSDNRLKVKPEAIIRLMSAAKNDLWKISSEIDKLVSYKPQGELTTEDIDQLCQGEAEAKIFDLVDAISTKNKAQANRLVHALAAAGENEFYIYTMLVSQFRNMLRVYDCQKKGIFSPGAISQSLGIHPFVATKTIGQLRFFSLPQLKALFQLAAELDYEVKKGERTIEDAFTYFIARV